MSVTVYALSGIAIILVLWYAAVLGALYRARTRPLRPGPATMALGTEPPAVVNLLVNRGEVTADAADATLLDLAARRILELYQPATDDQAELLVRVRVRGPAGLAGSEPAGLAGLTGYERRVFDRVAAIAGDQFVPLARISAGYAEAGPNWFTELRREIVADARARGLVYARQLSTTMVFVCVAAGIAIGCLALLPFAAAGTTPNSGAGTGATTNAIGYASVFGWLCATPFIAMILILGTVVLARVRGVRLSPSGRESAGRWLGVATWLAAHEALADLPPEAVAVWDRYLSYGVALGTNPAASAAVDLRVGRTSWFTSGYTGSVRTIRVRYPRDPFAYTQAGVRLLWSLLVLAGWGVGGYLLWPRVGRAPVEVRYATAAVVILVLVRALYKLVRALIAKALPVSVTGQVLTLHAYRAPVNSPVSWYQLVIDDGRRDRTWPWLVRADRIAGIRPGDVVDLRAQRWTRYVLELRVSRRRVDPIPWRPGREAR